MQSRINEIERELYAPDNYVASGVMGQAVPGGEQQRRHTALAEELNRLRKQQIEEAAKQFGPRAPIGGQRLTTGYVRLPEPAEPENWASDWMSTEGGYDPIRRYVEVDLHREWDD